MSCIVTLFFIVFFIGYTYCLDLLLSIIQKSAADFKIFLDFLKQTVHYQHDDKAERSMKKYMDKTESVTLLTISLLHDFYLWSITALLTKINFPE
ncbi:hypothetical protein H839_16973 [Parageobacillus genomosp. 1]|uniref:Uncharacterized protein n=1 Tax=Parageobacillus genomosp. 1 TaxID=1295642 RepID=A0ABC9VAW4_9BACL|nr:hypothetical protein H839_16973 [Parageobacillus genomosp. 1]